MLETKRLILRHWEDADASSLYLYARDPQVALPAGYKPHDSVEYSRAYIRTVYNKDEVYAIMLKNSEGAPIGPIGNIGLVIGTDFERGRLFDEGEIGFWLGAPFWGRGLMTEAVKELTRHGLYDLGLNKIWCSYYEGNYRSRILQKKCGFKYDHTVNNSKVIMLDQIRVEHFNYIDKTII